MMFLMNVLILMVMVMIGVTMVVWQVLMQPAGSILPLFMTCFIIIIVMLMTIFMIYTAFMKPQIIQVLVVMIFNVPPIILLMPMTMTMLIIVVMCRKHGQIGL